ncbi:hypothetical protein HK102_011133 [Quaeritorhiza haematococci]|nr:hypothetical protein HK102_011133 [Quaeritorhiza haematococci]
MATVKLAKTYTNPERVAAIITGIAGSLSFLCSMTMMGHLIYKRRLVNVRNRMLFALAFMDMMQAFGTSLGIWTWISQGGISLGPICTFQGFMFNFADVALFLWNTVIAAYTYMKVVHNRDVKNIEYICLPIVMTITTILACIGFAFGARDGRPFYAVAGYWCWINEPYSAYRLWFHYYIAFAVMVILFAIYANIAFHISKHSMLGLTGRFSSTGPLTGNNTSSKKSWYGGGLPSFNNKSRNSSDGGMDGGRGSADQGPGASSGPSTAVGTPAPGDSPAVIFNLPVNASAGPSPPRPSIGNQHSGLSTHTKRTFSPIKLIWIPITFTIAVFPLATIRVLQFVGITPSFPVLALAVVLFLSLGTADTILYFYLIGAFDGALDRVKRALCLRRT